MGRRRSFVRNIKRAGRRGLPFTRLLGSTVGMGLALAATSAWAQTPPAESPTKSTDGKDDVSLPGVDVRGQRNQFKIEEPSLYKLPDSIKDTPQSITVLPEQVLEERALFTLRAARTRLSDLPGALQAYERAAQHAETREAAQKEVAKVREAMKGPSTGTAPDRAMPGSAPGQPVPSRRY